MPVCGRCGYDCSGGALCFASCCMHAFMYGSLFAWLDLGCNGNMIARPGQMRVKCTVWRIPYNGQSGAFQLNACRHLLFGVLPPPFL